MKPKTLLEKPLPAGYAHLDGYRYIGTVKENPNWKKLPSSTRYEGLRGWPLIALMPITSITFEKIKLFAKEEYVLSLKTQERRAKSKTVTAASQPGKSTTIPPPVKVSQRPTQDELPFGTSDLGKQLNTLFKEVKAASACPNWLRGIRLKIDDRRGLNVPPGFVAVHPIPGKTSGFSHQLIMVKSPGFAWRGDGTLNPTRHGGEIFYAIPKMWVQIDETAPKSTVESGPQSDPDPAPAPPLPRKFAIVTVSGLWAQCEERDKAQLLEDFNKLVANAGPGKFHFVEILLTKEVSQKTTKETKNLYTSRTV